MFQLYLGVAGRLNPKLFCPLRHVFCNCHPLHSTNFNRRKPPKRVYSRIACLSSESVNFSAPEVSDFLRRVHLIILMSVESMLIFMRVKRVKGVEGGGGVYPLTARSGLEKMIIGYVLQTICFGMNHWSSLSHSQATSPITCPSIPARRSWCTVLVFVRTGLAIRV